MCTNKLFRAIIYVYLPSPYRLYVVTLLLNYSFDYDPIGVGARRYYWRIVSNLHRLRLLFHPEPCLFASIVPMAFVTEQAFDFNCFIISF